MATIEKMKKRYYCDSHVEKEENNNENSESDTAMFSSAELFCRKIRRATYPYSPKQGHFRALYILLQATCLIQKHPCSHIAVKPMSQPRKRGCILNLVPRSWVRGCCILIANYQLPKEF
jgi:hypothetical protein